ncbi:NAD(P)-dependent oxidoreductase [Carnimonas bestiolae]|uniref:NAD(P)-dependent oxidoreductase n=1 Tax=Carnimonas bestiolae TaxID=3402172 RepID=UPI003EDB7E86
MSTSQTVAVLGLGTMGHPFAANLVAKGFDVHVWNRSPGKDEDLVAQGATRADSPAAAVASAEVVISMLSTPEVTEAVLFGDQGALAAMQQNAVLAQMGTIGEEATLRLAEKAKQEYPAVVWLDAPVSGSKVPAEKAQVLVLASGDEERGKVAQPAFDAIGKGTKWLGPIGAGSRMKLVVNAWLIMLMQAINESSILADHFGFSNDDLWSVLEGGPLAVPYMKPKLAKIGSDDYSTEMALEWGLKDALLALDEANADQLPSLKRVAEVWQQATDDGLGEKDISVVADFLRKSK